MNRLLPIILLVFISATLKSIPPQPTLGYRWVIIDKLSDEFNGLELDKSKWNNYHPNWKGRAPAMFNPEAISVLDGYMQIKNGILDPPIDDFTLYGGAVTSVDADAFYGYYECNLKASRTTMSTTFWLSTYSFKLLEPGLCEGDSYETELDIQECIGDPQTWPGFGTHQKVNTERILMVLEPWRYSLCFSFIFSRICFLVAFLGWMSSL